MSKHQNTFKHRVGYAFIMLVIALWSVGLSLVSKDLITFLVFLFSGVVWLTYIYFSQRHIATQNKQLEAAELQQEELAWVRQALTSFSKTLIGDITTDQMANNALTCLVEFTDSQLGSLYLLDEKTEEFYLAACYGLNEKPRPERFIAGQGQLGQVAVSRKHLLINDIQSPAYLLTTSCVEIKPSFLLIYPIIHQGKVLGVFELAGMTSLAPIKIEGYLTEAASSLAIALKGVITYTKNKKLLAHTQTQAEELMRQQYELQQLNEELEEQTELLKANEERLKNQQEELQQSNEELEQQSLELTEQNAELDQVRQTLIARSHEIERASQYKSEFLANMSHELRTPLNSLLILSRMLSENREANLSPKQVESAKVIYRAGNDLLSIINDILDLAKIEAGKMSLEQDWFNITEFARELQELYQPAATAKGLKFECNLSFDSSLEIYADRRLVAQVLRNFLSNAIKFTTQGYVGLSIDLEYDDNQKTIGAIRFTVADSGIGIDQSKQRQIWEAFQQADGSISREYGGSGLGLTICKKIAALLGADIELQSQTAEGSKFSFVLSQISSRQQPGQGDVEDNPDTSRLNRPQNESKTKKFADHSAEKEPSQPIFQPKPIPMDSQHPVIMIVEDDAAFASVLSEICYAREQQVLITDKAEEAIKCLSQHEVKGVFLDLHLAGESGGWSVLEVIKTNPKFVHIPVFIMSCEDMDMKALQFGAAAFYSKPISEQQIIQSLDRIAHLASSQKRILIINNDTHIEQILSELQRTESLIIETCSGDELFNSGNNSLLLEQKSWDLVILSASENYASTSKVLNELKSCLPIPLPPVIVYSETNLADGAYRELMTLTDKVILKGVQSEKRLLEETTLFLHTRVERLSERLQNLLKRPAILEQMFSHRKVLVVDDDIRNVYAMTALLESRGIEVLIAENGEQALQELDKTQDIDLVFMDVMMPVMDGLEAIQRIRRQSKFQSLPVITLTAKALPEDRNKAIAAGATDYLPKPLNADKLLSLLRIWLG